MAQHQFGAVRSSSLRYSWGHLHDTLSSCAAPGSRLYAGRAVGGDCHHRRSRGSALACRASRREAARCSSCNNNLKQSVLGLHNYEATYKTLPSRQCGSGNINKGGHRLALAGWVSLLPYCEQQPLYDTVMANPMEPWGGHAWCRRWSPTSSVRATKAEWSRTVRRTRGLNSYAFCTGDDYAASQTTPQERGSATLAAQQLPIRHRGIFGRHSYPTLADILDGTSNTIALGERRGQ